MWRLRRPCKYRLSKSCYRLSKSSCPVKIQNSGNRGSEIGEQGGLQSQSLNVPSLWKVSTMAHSMDPVSWLLQIPSNPRSTSSTSSASDLVSSRLSPLFLRGSIRPSGPDDKPRQKISQTVSWDTHVEVWQQAPRSVSWSTHVQVFVIPARERAPDNCDPR